MSKIKYYDVDKKERSRIISELYGVIADLKSKEEVFKFLFELFTPSEVIMIARRIQVAKMLLDDITYTDISKQIKVSPQTIQKIEHWLKSDEERAKLIDVKLRKTRKNDGHKQIYFGKRSRLDKYPGHRLLKSIISA